MPTERTGSELWWHWKKRDLLSGARKRAKKKGLSFSLVYEDIFIPLKCPVLGIPLFSGSAASRDNSPSLDRIDNNKGYVKGNIIVISYRANRLKSDSNPIELKKIIKFYGNLKEK